MRAPDFENMNETDVRETIVRPLLERLGYRHGTEANIRTEMTLRYDRAFLGRKNAKKDPPLVGRADYICELISFSKWVVEVKAPGEEIDRDAIEQAHTYAAHPEIAASHFIVTNGRQFHLYQTSRLSDPVLRWNFEEQEEKFLLIFNIVGPEAMRKRALLGVSDPGKPLGQGVASRAAITGGEITYNYNATKNPLLPLETLSGMQLAITGGSVMRIQDGRIKAHIYIASAAPMYKELNEILGVRDGYEFYSSSEYISH